MSACARVVLLVALIGCNASDAPSLFGVVFDGRGNDASPLGGAELRVISPARGDVVGTATADANGAFEMPLSRGADGVAIEVRAPGYVTTVFHGNAPLDGPIEVEEGGLFAVAEAEIDATRARWAGCPRIDDAVGMVLGEVRVFDLVDPLTGDSPLTSEGQVDVVGIDELGKVSDTWGGCYLDEAGEEHDPTAEFTGQSGQFAVFGVAPGFHEIRAQWQFAPNQWNLEVYPAWVPEDEPSVIPLWPAWVRLGSR